MSKGTKSWVSGAMQPGSRRVLTEEEQGRRPFVASPGAREAASSDLTAHWGALIAVGVLAGLIVAWALVGFFFDPLSSMTLIPPRLRGGEEVAEALIRIFGGLVLIMFLADDEMGRRLRWVASGLFVLGSGFLIFGYVEPMFLGETPLHTREHLDEELYQALLVHTVTGILFVVALVSNAPPAFVGRSVAAVLVLLGVAYVVLFELLIGARVLPPLVNIDDLERMVAFGVAPSGWFTTWHWAFGALPLALSVAVVAGAIRQSRRGTIRRWLLIAMVLWSGSLLHEYVYPWAYDSLVLTSADVLHLGMAAVVAVGGIIELRRVAVERTALLAAERDRVRRLDEFAVLRADFVNMVAHELGSPLSAIRRLTEVLSIENLDPRARTSSLAIMEGQISILEALVKDVRSAAAAEHDDFEVVLRLVPLDDLMANAEAFADTLAANHRLDIFVDESLKAREQVLADPERLGQVFRNLLSNAAKYSPEGEPIELRASQVRGRVSIEIADRGPGIHPDDVALIFEKFGRGRDQEGRKIPGVGLGLYLSRRIVQNHGSDLRVSSGSEGGSVFSFELEMAR